MKRLTIFRRWSNIHTDREWGLCRQTDTDFYTGLCIYTPYPVRKLMTSKCHLKGSCCILLSSCRVSHLILVDPWGFPERTQTQTQEHQGTEVVKRPPLPRWVKAVATVVSLFNPLAVIRAAGPWGKMCHCFSNNAPCRIIPII